MEEIRNMVVELQFQQQQSNERLDRLEVRLSGDIHNFNKIKGLQQRLAAPRKDMHILDVGYDEEFLATKGWKWKIFMAVFILQLSYYSVFAFTFNHQKLHHRFTFWWDLVTMIIGVIDLVLKRITSTGFTRTGWCLYICNILGYFPWIVTYKICRMAIQALRWKPWKWTKVLRFSVYMIGFRALFIVTAHCYLNTVKRRMSRHLMRSVALLISRFVVLTIYWVHFVACLYFGLAMIWPDPTDTWLGNVTMNHNKTYDFNKEAVWKNYGICFYYAMSTITTLGYGDIHAVNILEMYVTPIMLLSNMVVMTYIGSDFVGPLLAHRNEKSALRQQD